MCVYVYIVYYYACSRMCICIFERIIHMEANETCLLVHSFSGPGSLIEPGVHVFDFTGLPGSPKDPPLRTLSSPSENCDYKHAQICCAFMWVLVMQMQILMTGMLRCC